MYIIEFSKETNYLTGKLIDATTEKEIGNIVFDRPLNNDFPLSIVLTFVGTSTEYRRRNLGFLLMAKGFEYIYSTDYSIKNVVLSLNEASLDEYYAKVGFVRIPHVEKMHAPLDVRLIQKCLERYGNADFIVIYPGNQKDEIDHPIRALLTVNNPTEGTSRSPEALEGTATSPEALTGLSSLSSKPSKGSDAGLSFEENKSMTSSKKTNLSSFSIINDTNSSNAAKTSVFERDYRDLWDSHPDYNKKVIALFNDYLTSPFRILFNRAIAPPFSNQANSLLTKIGNVKPDDIESLINYLVEARRDLPTVRPDEPFLHRINFALDKLREALLTMNDSELAKISRKEKRHDFK